MTTTPQSNEPPLIARIHQMVTDPLFVRFHQLVDEPNIFRIVGQKNYERWHSGFWAWLLDIDGSHGLGAYPLELFILHALTHDTVLPKDIEKKRKAFLSVPMWADGTVEPFTILPNEYNPQEYSTKIDGVNAFFDILLDGKTKYEDTSTNTTKNISFALLVEMKVKATSTVGQATRYADWFEQQYRSQQRLLVYVLPSNRIRESVEATIGDPRWCIVTYQSLHDDVLTKLLSHHKLTDHARWVIGEYIKNLRTERKGDTMAITREERELAQKIYEKYGSTLHALQEALQIEGEEELDFDVPTNDRKRTIIEVKVAGKKIVAKTFRQLANDVVSELNSLGKLDDLLLPWGAGNSRYFMVRVDLDDGSRVEPKHIRGNPFVQPEFVGTRPRYAIETHISREAGLNMLRRLCEDLNVKWEVVSQ
jgi:hypothetical protein